jgi:glucose-6-phosphate 1-dehydrogenase
MPAPAGAAAGPVEVRAGAGGEPACLAIFGAAGDLTWRKLGPALYNLSLDGKLPGHFALVGIDGRQMGKADFQRRLRDGIEQFSRRRPIDERAWGALAASATYICGDFDSPQTFAELGEELGRREKLWGHPGNRTFYLAVPPTVMASVVRGLDQSRLTQDRGRSRIVVEKPFGRDLDSARALNGGLAQVCAESQIYRIDHYLGKETVQNILAFRFANALFEPVWDRRYIDHVQVTVAEQVGVEHRGGYYERAGALRDMIQNHLLQVLCLVAMEPMVSFDADEIRNKKVDVLRAIRPIRREEVSDVAVRGQYGAGWIEGERVPAYRDEPSVARDSTTETFAALKLFVDNWRWQDVPFYLRTGKRLAARSSEVVIRFRPVPHRSFPSSSVAGWQPNRLVIRIQPREGIALRFQAKRPGPDMRLAPVEMNFGYQEAFHAPAADAYETLLLDAMRGDATLFMRADQVEAAWAAITPILEAWEEAGPTGTPTYAAGSWGPGDSEALIARDGRSWLEPADADG